MFNSLSQQEYGEAKYGEHDDRDGLQAMKIIHKKWHHLKREIEKKSKVGCKLSKNKVTMCKDCCLRRNEYRCNDIV